jgi:hypothetical protein
LNLGVQRERLNRGNKFSSPIEQCCPYCKNPEAFLHLLTCTDSKAPKLLYEATVLLRKALSDDQGARAIYRAIQQWTINPSMPISLSAGKLSEQTLLNEALASQTDIGWLNLFQGFVSTDWSLLPHREYISTGLELRPSTADHSLSKSILALQDYSLALWKSCNTVLHEANSPGLDIVHAYLNQAITQLYELQPTPLSSILQSYVTVPLHNRLQRPPRQRKRWLQLAQLAQLATAYSSSWSSSQQLLPTYFPHAPSQG